MMTVTKDWFPKSREEQLNMAKEWERILPAKGMDWNIPEEDILEFLALTGAADTALITVKNGITRTPVAMLQCRAVFKKLEVKMRDIKRRYFFVPPLTWADLGSLGLKVPDGVYTPSGFPTAEAMVQTFLRGRHELGIKIVYVSGNPSDRANKGFRIWYKTVPPGGKPVISPRQLDESFFTRHRKDVVVFDFEDSGKTAYLAVQIENGSKKGAWGPLVNAIIP
jgi:hypothetical protein